MRGESISPTESVGKAEGLDEDEDGAVRSEGSGPQSLTRAFRATGAPGVLRTNNAHQNKANQFKLAPEIFTIS